MIGNRALINVNPGLPGRFCQPLHASIPGYERCSQADARGVMYSHCLSDAQRVVYSRTPPDCSLAGVAMTPTPCPGNYGESRNYSPICLMILRGSIPSRSALLASMVIWSSALLSNASAMAAAFLTISSTSSRGKVIGSGSGQVVAVDNGHSAALNVVAPDYLITA